MLTKKKKKKKKRYQNKKNAQQTTPIIAALWELKCYEEFARDIKGVFISSV